MSTGFRVTARSALLAVQVRVVPAVMLAARVAAVDAVVTAVAVWGPWSGLERVELVGHFIVLGWCAAGVDLHCCVVCVYTGDTRLGHKHVGTRMCRMCTVLDQN